MLTAKRRHRALGVAGALLAAAVVPLGWSLAAAPAHAATGCKLWLYENRDFNFNGGDMSCYYSWGGNVGSVLNNRASSIQNNLGVTMCVYDGASMSGWSMAVGAGSYYRNLARDAAPDGGTWNDRITSVGQC